MSNDDAWHVRIPRRLQASVERIAIEEDRHPASSAPIADQGSLSMSSATLSSRSRDHAWLTYWPY